MNRCPSCQVAIINGVRCHEYLCPDAWRDATRECPECGTLFRPEDAGQRHCSEDCYAAYYGHPDESGDCHYTEPINLPSIDGDGVYGDIPW